MPKLDRSYSTSGNIYEQKKEVLHYKKMNSVEKGEVFAYLNSISYNYPLGSPPKMDKTIFSSRKM